MTPRMQSSTTETRTCGAGLRSTTDTSEQARHTTGALETEVRTMQLSELLDLGTEAQEVGETIPCRDYDAELWFAERPEDVEFAKTLCGLCPARCSASPGRSSGRSRGASGAGSCSSRGPWSPGSDRVGTSAQAPGRGLNDTGPRRAGGPRTPEPSDSQQHLTRRSSCENLELLARDRIRDRAQRQDRSGIRRSARLIALEIRASRRNHQR